MQEGIVGCIRRRPNEDNLNSKEAFRLMGYTDEEYDCLASRFKEYQLYGLIGNGICLPCTIALLSQLDELGVKHWNDMSDKEREDVSLPYLTK